MAEKARNSGEFTTEQTMPVTPAPTRSQTNLASRALGVEKPLSETLCRGTPQAAAKPPPEVPENFRRRSADAGAVRSESPEEVNSGQPEGREDFAREAKRRNLSPIAARALLAIICIMTGMFVPVGRHRARNTSTSQSPVLTVPAPIAVSEQAQYAVGLPREPEAALTTALDDLDKAVRDRTESPEQILKIVSRPGQDCTLAWTGHYPSLVFGKKGGPNSIAVTLEGCAQAVFRLRK